jgi:hypothetical protein
MARVIDQSRNFAPAWNLKEIMSPGHWMAIAALLAAPIATTAQEKRADPTDPSAAAAPYRYESAFRRYQPVSETEESPAQAWRAANDEMGRLGGHAGHVKGAEAADGSADSAPSGQAHHGMDHQNKGK